MEWASPPGTKITPSPTTATARSSTRGRGGTVGVWTVISMALITKETSRARPGGLSGTPGGDSTTHSSGAR